MAFLFRALRAIYNIDTLDTRLTTPSNVSYRTVLDAREHKGDDAAKPVSAYEARVREAAGPSRWKTLEFYGYYAILSVVIPYMLWVPYSASRPSHPQYHKYEKWLSPGWVPGRKIDNTDAQYSLFRGNMLYLVLLLIFHPLLRRLYTVVVSSPTTAAPSSPRASLVRLAQRTTFDAVFAIIFLLALHGLSTFKILAILVANYRIAKRVPRPYVPALTWTFNIVILFANDIYNGYSFAAMGRRIQPLFPGLSPDEYVPGVLEPGAIEKVGAWLDGQRGLIGRWEILFNLTVLRLISFNMDYYWSLDPHKTPSLEKKQLDMADLSEKDRVAVPAPPEAFTFSNYIGYAIYAPLYLTGPIITFNDYISQSRNSPATIEVRRTLRYGIRFLFALLAMELLLHFHHIGAISKAHPVWTDYTATQLALLAYFNLHVIWLKLLIPWRLSRLWALLDGVDPPENMIRCVSNNYSTLFFWRGWHRSYNRWIVRYIYVPLGGTSFKTPLQGLRSVTTYALVFTFVALWHDIKLRLLAWGWLIVLFMLPEMVLLALIPKKVLDAHPTAYRMFAAAGGVTNIFTMVSANLVGFAFGVDGLHEIIRTILGDSTGIIMLIGAWSTLFAGVHVMFEVRQEEMRRGHLLRC